MVGLNNDEYNMNINDLPYDVRREINRFIPRHDMAQIFYESSNTISLKYVRKYHFENNILNEKRIWKELSPVHLKSIYYGDQNKILRREISKAQHILLKKNKII